MTFVAESLAAIERLAKLEAALSELVEAWRTEDEESRSHGCADELSELIALHERARK